MPAKPTVSNSRGVPLRARLWDAFVRSIGVNLQKKRAIQRIIDRPGRILEVGCATGNVAGIFRQSEYVGVDIDRDSIALAALRHPGRNYAFHCLDLLEDALPFEAGFDHVLISHTAHHLPDEYLLRLLERSSELLRPDGRLVVLDMLRPAPHEPLNRQFYYRLDRGRHFRTLNEFKTLFARTNALCDTSFEVVRTTKWGIRVIDQVLISGRPRRAAQ